MVVVGGVGGIVRGCGLSGIVGGCGGLGMAGGSLDIWKKWEERWNRKESGKRSVWR